MKNFILVVLVLIIVVFCSTGCKVSQPTEVTQEPLPTNGIVVTPEEELETVEAEEAIIEIVNK